MVLPRLNKGTVLITKTTWINCRTCGKRAYWVADWRPQLGIHPNMRQFMCKDDHYTHLVLTQAEIDKLSVRP